MPKHLLALLFLVPLAASAECGFLRSDDTMTIVVSKKASSCFSSTEFKDAFMSDLAEATDPGGARQRRRQKGIDERSASGERLWALEERVHQATVPDGRYFGQQR